jgi:hypothetical protein
MSEQRLNAVIVAATLAVVALLILGLVALADSYEPQRGDDAMKALAD